MDGLPILTDDQHHVGEPFLHDDSSLPTGSIIVSLPTGYRIAKFSRISVRRGPHVD